MVSAFLGVSGCNCAIVFDLVEESLDEVSLAIKSKVAQALDDPVCFGRNNGARTAFCIRSTIASVS